MPPLDHIICRMDVRDLKPHLLGGGRVEMDEVDGIRLSIAGATTLDEVRRVAGDGIV